MTEAPKDTIYIDVDDEITGIIDKVRSSKHKIVALVLPKRSTVFQSIVNMKLLKRKADSADKNLVLITSETSLLPLAGAVGLHVAKTLQSKPEIPDEPDVPTKDDSPAVIGATKEDKPEPEEDSEGEELDANKSVGELAGMPAEEETIEVDNETPDTPEKGKKSKSDRKLKIPNFERFRTRLFLGIGGFILLIVLWFIGFVVMPKAQITIKTDTTSEASNISFTVDTAASTVDTAGQLIPGVLKQVQKTDSQTAGATGQKDLGTKASGTAALTNCGGDAVTVPAGTGISNGGLTFITQKSLSLDSGNFTGGGVCKTTGTHVGSSAVVAQNNGSQYNIVAANYTVAGFSSVKASGSAMTGGTSNIVTVISQKDADSAKAKLVDKKDEAKSELTKILEASSMFVITDSFSNPEPTITTNPAVDSQGGTVTVSSNTTYSMVGVKEDDLKKLIDEAIKGQIDTNKQSVQDYGLDKAKFSLNTATDPKKMQLSIQTSVSIGPKFNVDELKKLVAGKKTGDVKDLIGRMSGVKEVKVDNSPFWISKTPKKPARITIIFEKTN